MRPYPSLLLFPPSVNSLSCSALRFPALCKEKSKKNQRSFLFFNSRFHPISFLSSFWLIPNFLSSFIELWCSQIFLSYGGFTRERAFVLWRILCCNADWVFAVSTNTLRDYSFHTHDTPNTPYRSNNSTRVSYCWMFSLKEVLFRSVSRSICINHTLVNVVHSTLTCGATNKSYWPSVPICWFATTQLLVNQSISFILCWRLSFIHLRCSDRYLWYDLGSGAHKTRILWQNIIIKLLLYRTIPSIGAMHDRKRMERRFGWRERRHVPWADPRSYP